MILISVLSFPSKNKTKNDEKSIAFSLAFNQSKKVIFHVFEMISELEFSKPHTTSFYIAFILIFNMYYLRHIHCMLQKPIIVVDSHNL